LRRTFNLPSPEIEILCVNFSIRDAVAADKHGWGAYLGTDNSFTTILPVS
jgi:hypothetical protein